MRSSPRGGRRGHGLRSGERYKGTDRRIRLSTASTTVIERSTLGIALACAGGFALVLRELLRVAPPDTVVDVGVVVQLAAATLLTATACADAVVWRLSGRAPAARRVTAWLVLAMAVGADVTAQLLRPHVPGVAVAASWFVAAAWSAGGLALLHATLGPEVDTSLEPVGAAARLVTVPLLVAAVGAALAKAGFAAATVVPDVGRLLAAATWAGVAVASVVRPRPGDDVLVKTAIGAVGAGVVLSRPLMAVAAAVAATALVVAADGLLRVHAVLGEERDEGRELVALHQEAESLVVDARGRIHEIVSALAALRAVTEAREVPAEAREAASDLHAQLDAVLRMSARTGTGVMPVDVHDELVLVVRLARRRGQHVDLVGEPAVASAIPGCVSAVVRTLLDNAYRHARGSSVSVTVRTVTPPDAGACVEIAVQDDGPGVGPGVAPLLFVPGSGTAGGSGLGLASARRRAKASGGDLFLDPDALGARFVLRLPAAPREITRRRGVGSIRTPRIGPAPTGAASIGSPSIGTPSGGIGSIGTPPDGTGRDGTTASSTEDVA